MKKTTIGTLLFSLLFATAALAVEVQTEVDFDSLQSAEDLSATMSINDREEHVGDHIGTPYFPPHHNRGVRCFAASRRGYRFEAYGRFPRETQERALQQCYRSGARMCRPLGCDRI